MGLGIKKYPKPSYFGSGRTRLSCCARVWSLGRFPYDSGWSTGRLAALPSPSLRSKLPRSPLLRTSFCPWFHLNFLPPSGRTLDPGNGGRPAGHFLPTAHGRLWARSRGPCTGRPLSCAGYTGLLLPLLAVWIFYHPLAGKSRPSRAFPFLLSSPGGFSTPVLSIFRLVLLSP